jgi:hypothetical protein
MAKSTTGRQTSTKAGVTSLAKKQDNSRHGFATHPASRKAAGASGLEGRGAARHSGASTPKGGKKAALRSMKGSTRRG